MVQESSSILMEQNMMANGKMIFDMDLEHIYIPMAINMKETGIMTFNKEWELITTRMETFIKVNGSRESQMEKEITFIEAVRQFTKEIGQMGKSKALENWSYRKIMVTLESGEITKNKAKDVIFIQMVRNMMGNG